MRRCLRHGVGLTTDSPIGSDWAFGIAPALGSRPRKVALPRTEEEHGAVDDAVGAVQPVDGARKVDGTEWTRPSESGKCGLNSDYRRKTMLT